MSALMSSSDSAIEGSSRIGLSARQVPVGVRRLVLEDPRAEEPAVGHRLPADRIEEGAQLLLGGADAPEGFPKGYYVKPTVFGKVKADSTIAQEEIFGPVGVVIKFEDETGQPLFVLPSAKCRSAY